jgi:hypothetical protein
LTEADVLGGSVPPNTGEGQEREGGTRGRDEGGLTWRLAWSMTHFQGRPRQESKKRTRLRRTLVQARNSPAKRHRPPGHDHGCPPPAPRRQPSHPDPETHITPPGRFHERGPRSRSGARNPVAAALELALPVAVAGPRAGQPTPGGADRGPPGGLLDPPRLTSCSSASRLSTLTSSTSRSASRSPLYGEPPDLVPGRPATSADRVVATVEDKARGAGQRTMPAIAVGPQSSGCAPSLGIDWSDRGEHEHGGTDEAGTALRRQGRARRLPNLEQQSAPLVGRSV